MSDLVEPRKADITYGGDEPVLYEADGAIAWITLTIRVTPPALTPTLVRAMAAVAGTPPKNGMTILPMPWATSS